MILVFAYPPRLAQSSSAGASHARVLGSVRAVMREHGIADVTVQLEVEGDCDLLAGDCDDTSGWNDEQSSERASGRGSKSQ